MLSFGNRPDERCEIDYPLQPSRSAIAGLYQCSLETSGIGGKIALCEAHNGCGQGS